MRLVGARIHADTGNPLEGARLLDEGLAGLEAEIKIDPPTKPRDATSCCSPPPAPACAGRLSPRPPTLRALRRMLDNFPPAEQLAGDFYLSRWRAEAAYAAGRAAPDAAEQLRSPRRLKA